MNKTCADKTVLLDANPGELWELRGAAHEQPSVSTGNQYVCGFAGVMCAGAAFAFFDRVFRATVSAGDYHRALIQIAKPLERGHKTLVHVVGLAPTLAPKFLGSKIRERVFIPDHRSVLDIG